MPPFGNITCFTARKLNARYIAEVLDLWPESFVAFGLVKKSNPFLKLSYFFEKWLYNKADNVVFSMEGGKDYIVEKKWDKESGGPIDLSKVHYINNGVDLSDFDSFKEKFILDDKDLEDKTIFKVVYLGSIRLANDLKRLIDAAILLKEQSKIRFLIYGDGGDRKTLEDYCLKNNIDNVIFKQKWIDPKYVAYVLSHSDLNILNYMPNEIFRFGGSQSKFFQYLASGKPICSNLKMGYCLINKYKLGIAKRFDTDHEYANAILSIKELSIEQYQDMCMRVRNLASSFDYPILTKKVSVLL
jgi:glycosyltransferase involved in cell wall biosynthesis